MKYYWEVLIEERLNGEMDVHVVSVSSMSGRNLQKKLSKKSRKLRRDKAGRFFCVSKGNGYPPPIEIAWKMSEWDIKSIKERTQCELADRGGE